MGCFTDGSCIFELRERLGSFLVFSSSVQASKGSRGLLSIRYIACLHATTIMVCYYHLYATALQFASHRSDDGYVHSFPSHFGWTEQLFSSGHLLRYLSVRTCTAFAYCTQLDPGAILLPEYIHH